MDRRDLNLLQQESASVVCNYSDFVLQCFAQLRGREKECLDLVELCEQLRRKWKESSEHCMLAEEKAHRLEQEKEELRAEYELLKERYHDSNAKVGALISQRDDLKKEINEYQQRIRSIRTLMENELKDTAAFGRLMNLSKFDERRSDNLNKSRATRSNDFGLEVDFDKSLDDEENIDEVHLRYNRTYQRRSKSVDTDAQRTKSHVTKRSRLLHENIQEVDEDEGHLSTPPKKFRDEVHEDEITTVTTITVDPRGRSATKASVEVHRGGKRSMSEPRGHDAYSHTPVSQRSFRLGASNADLRSPLTGLGSSWTKGRPILECDHYFESGKGALMKNCAVCNRTVTMQNVVKCKDCHIYLHNNCKARAPRPCLPFTADKTSKGTPQKKKVPRLADLCPTTPPLVPAILIRLIYEIENSRLEAEGLYRVPGNKELVTKLLANMAGNIIPQLQNEHTEVLTSSVKRFLMNLKEPLIPNSSYNEFLQAVRDPSGDLLMKAFAELPEPNKDTLAFICLHLQKVAKFSHTNKMTIPNLAISIGVTVVRGGRRDEINTLDRNDYGAEAERQRQLMERLLLLPEDYWENYLNSRMLIVASQVRTPRLFTPRNADQSILGPVSETPPLNFTPTLRSAKRRGLNVNMY
ncbi:unnamed protein product [Bursaphelenchus xylophilus]|uniref:(pine wood nematode) hypothetical protein n=1 Tax=Bursaphelenchus xylophilus TaxID=6326 RepID=A0A1I7RI49_BURXY|nr:unnamed protein product [Bursaphelenchus xylophilus]CAG9115157.1 unnamed protein product [Bursaphelenchus xylophilus]